jgi:hypothetical protein
MARGAELVEMEITDDKLIVSFLLGELVENKQVGIEERMFKDDGFYEQVLAIQEELADDYVQNKLSTNQRLQFERHFLRSPRRRERVQFARAFSRALAGENALTAAPASRSSWWESVFPFARPLSARATLAALAAVAVLLVAGSWLYIDNRELANRMKQARQERDALIDQARVHDKDKEQERQALEDKIAALRSRGDEMEGEIQRRERELEALKQAGSSNKIKASGAEIATFILLPGLTRGTDEPEKVMIPATSPLIELQLRLEKPEDYKGYVAEIRTARGTLIFSKSLPSARRTSFGQEVSLNLPTKLLPVGEYEVALTGAAEGKLQTVGYYYFIAVKR